MHEVIPDRCTYNTTHFLTKPTPSTGHPTSCSTPRRLPPPRYSQEPASSLTPARPSSPTLLLPHSTQPHHQAERERSRSSTPLRGPLPLSSTLCTPCMPREPTKPNIVVPQPRLYATTALIARRATIAGLTWWASRAPRPQNVFVVLPSPSCWSLLGRSLPGARHWPATPDRLCHMARKGQPSLVGLGQGLAVRTAYVLAGPLPKLAQRPLISFFIFLFT
jgi:hypothetical protein